MHEKIIRILYVTREPFPTFRVDVNNLFGKYLPRYGIFSSIIARRSEIDNQVWGGGATYLYAESRIPVIGKILNFFREVMSVLCNIKNYDVVQVRDKPIISIILIPISKLFRKKLYYWMSWPFSEDDLIRAKTFENKFSLKKIGLTIRSYFNRTLTYSFLFSYCDHIFVQSDAMKKWLSAKGINEQKMTAVPMGVDLEEVQGFLCDNVIIEKTRSIILIGSLSKTRRIDKIIWIFHELSKRFSDLKYVLVGDAPPNETMDYLRKEIQKYGLENKIIITGWVGQKEAWKWLKSAYIGINLVPRNVLFDTSTPTKVLEYAAFGLPCVVNDIPDQKEVIEKMECGICVNYNVKDVVNAVELLLKDNDLYEKFKKNGVKAVAKSRNYSSISEKLAFRYHKL